VSASVSAVDALVTRRVNRPNEDAVQILPGRLDVVEGDLAREIRFVRTWAEMPEVTIGRGAGPKYRHVQLQSPTVSRAHARFRFEGERWKITNLSETNPTVVNGATLAPRESRLLDHGDRVELGEVVLRFWEQ
jgi:predicted component of type VI protein secretion system